MTRGDSVTSTARRSPGTCHTVAMLVLAHRGASRDAPENTPEAFRLADRQGADGVELDVRLHPSGRLLVRHDPLPAEQLGRAASPPTLDDALDACGDRMLVNVEIKNLASDGGVRPDHVDRRAHDRRTASSRRAMVRSLADLVVLVGHDQACRRIAPEIPTALLCITIAPATIDRVVAARARRAASVGAGAGRGDGRRCHDGRPAGEHVDVRRPARASSSWPRAASTASCTNVPAIVASLRSVVQRRSGNSREHEPHRVGHVLELEAAGLAEGVAVDLVGERLVVLDDERAQVGRAGRGALRA